MVDSVAAAPPIVVHTTVHTTVHTGDLATTIVASLGVALALASLAWQAWSFKATGSRITVEVARGLKRGNAVAMTTADAKPSEIEGLRKQGFTEPTVAVRIYNAGRGSTSIVDILLSVGGGSGVTDAKLDPPLPFRLEGESEKTWHFDARLVQGVAQVWSEAAPDSSWDTVHAEVRIGGSRKVVRSENTVPVEALSRSG